MRRFQKLRDVAIDQCTAAGESVCHNRIASILGVSLKKYNTQSRMIAASETVSLSDPSTTQRLTG
jgi:hypothetical protein